GVHLIVPNVLSRVGIERDDRAQIEVVASAGTANFSVPRCSVARANVDPVQLRVIGHGIPRRAAPAEFPPLAGPSRGSDFHRRILKSVPGISGHDIKSPSLLAGMNVVRSDVSSYGADIRACVADHDFVLEGQGRSGDVSVVALGNGHDAPDGLAGSCMDSDQSTVLGADHHFIVGKRNAANAPALAELLAGNGGNLGIISPQQLSAD